MAQPGQQASLRDVLNYTPEQYFSPSELALIRSTFKNNPGLIKVLRKAFVPTVSDPELPIEEFGSDAFTAGRDYAAIPESEIKSIVVARQEAIKFIMGGLIKLRVIAQSEELTPEQKKEKARKDSTQ